MTDLDIRNWARLGAELRLAELRQEIGKILAAFPELGKGASGESGASKSTRTAAKRRAASSSTVRKKKKRRMSAEARRKISAAQKARWAKQKSAKTGKAAGHKDG